MLEDYEDMSGLGQEDLEDYDDLLGDLSDDEVDGLEAYMQMEGYELDNIADDVGASPRRRKLAKAAKRIKVKASRRAIPSVRLYKKAKKRRRAKRMRSFGGKSMVCGVQAPCAGLLPKNEPIYDTERLTSTQAAGDITFFAVPEGQTGLQSVQKAKYHTNMTTPRMLPVPQRFDVFGLSWGMDTATAAALNDIRNKCAVIFYIGNTPYTTLKLSHIPFYSSIQGAFDGQTNTPSNLAWCTGSEKGMYDLRTFSLKTGILIPQRIELQENFSVILKINEALSMGATKDISFTLHGIKWTEIRQG